jgi:MFS family permease
MSDFSKDFKKFFSKQLVANTFATASALSWFFIVTLNFGAFFQNVSDDKLWVFAGEVLFFVLGILSALIGVYISERYDRRKLLMWSISLGILSTLSLAILEGNVFSLLLGSLLGLSFGLGFPSAAALFSDNTEIEYRGRSTGILVLITFTLILVGIAVSQVSGLLELIALAVVIRALGYLSLTRDQFHKENRKVETWSSILSRRNLVYYLLPWIIFNLVSGLQNFIFPGLPKTPEYESAMNIGNLTQFVGVAVFSLVSGFVCDRFGRKPPIVIGILIFGISFAVLGVAPSPLSVIFQNTIFGVAWGFCMVAYFVIPADLARSTSREKHYALINVSAFVGFTGTVTLPVVLGTSMPVGILSPILSVFLFVSIVPVLFASETLPDSILKSRRMQEHIDRIAKEVDKSKKE